MGQEIGAVGAVGVVVGVGLIGVTGGAMGEMQDWYRLIRAARYLHVAPWDLADRSILWMKWALSAESIDSAVEAEMRRRK